MKAKWLGVAGVVMLLAASQAGAVVNFNDGGYHVIDYVIDDWVHLDHYEPDAGTQIEVVSGGWIKDTIEAHGTSRVIMNGGIASLIVAWSSADVVIYGGGVDAVSMPGTGKLEMYGGEVTESVGISDSSSAIIEDGIMGYIGVSGLLTMSGGTVLHSIEAFGNGLVTLIGTDFQVNGHDVSYGDLASTWATPGTDPWGQPWLTGIVTGILENGDTINNDFVFYYKGDITFVPEPSTLFLLLVGAGLIRNRNHN